MASNVSLSRRLTRRGNTLDAEREDFEKAQSAAVAKAVNSQECAVKAKHIRTLILGSHREHGAGTFWNYVIRLPLDGQPIIAWKFCHVFHKLMRDGHHNTLRDSMKFRTKIKDVGKMWGHLKGGYGSLILQYCKLLNTKLEFHSRNPRLPGSLSLSDKELESLGEKDPNNWFEISIEMLDYLEETLILQKQVFKSLDTSRASSMTASGQCRLAPIILCILDSSSLYDYLVKLIFKLHSSVPIDTLTGHRDRFNAQFKDLKEFYSHSSNLQYFKYLVSIPPLPENPPNFLIASEFDSYVTPHVTLHGEASDNDWDQTMSDTSSIRNEPLVDLAPSETSATDKFDDAFGDSTNGSWLNGSAKTDEKDHIIQSLQQDLEDRNTMMMKIRGQFDAAISQAQNRSIELEQQLGNSKIMLDRVSEENDRYRAQAEQLQNEKNQTTALRLEESEKKAHSNEERFKKMKDVYAKLRQEHIEALKKQGDLQSQMDKMKNEVLDSEDKQSLLSKELLSLKQERDLVEERALQGADEGSRLKEELNHGRELVHNLNQQILNDQSERRKEKEEFESKLRDLQSTNQQLKDTIGDRDDTISILFSALCKSCISSLTECEEEFDNPAHLAVNCGPEYVLTRTGPCLEALNDLKVASLQSNVTNELVSSVSHLTCLVSSMVLHGKATANAAPTNQTQALTDECKLVADNLKICMEQLQSYVQPNFDTVAKSIEAVNKRLRQLQGQMGDVKAEQLGELIDKEMNDMDVAIQAAAGKIQEMMSRSRETHTGIKLEVNEKILDACTSLMQAVLILVQKSRDLQAEIVAAGKGGGSTHEFYKRNHPWTEGLLSAAKAVGLGCKILVDSADRVISGNGKLEELMVASQQIAASTAQLVVSSKVKAERDSERMTSLSKASKGVTTATANVLGTVKSGRVTLEQAESLDFSKMTVHHAKQVEMETQVHVLELEAKLDAERRKLAEMRRQFYNEDSPNGSKEFKIKHSESFIKNFR